MNPYLRLVPDANQSTRRRRSSRAESSDDAFQGVCKLDQVKNAAIVAGLAAILGAGVWLVVKGLV
jgi:hypothetical protein